MGKYGLLIGTSQYEDVKLSSLKWPAADIASLEVVLQNPEIGAFDDTLSLVNETDYIVRRAIARFFSNRQRDDFLLLYYSGHGVKDEWGRLYFTFKNSEAGNLAGTAVSDSYISEQMDDSRSQTQLLILDTCYSGAFGRGTKAGLGTPIGLGEAFNIQQGVGRFVLSATNAVQFAWEGDRILGGVRNSLFTHFLVQGLQSGVADIDHDGYISLDDLYEYLLNCVKDSTSSQTPQLISRPGMQRGKLIIASNPRASQDLDISNWPSDAMNSTEPTQRLVAVAVLRGIASGMAGENRTRAVRALEEMAESDSDNLVRSTASLALEKTSILGKWRPDSLDVASKTQDRPSEVERIKRIPRWAWMVGAGGIAMVVSVIIASLGGALVASMFGGRGQEQPYESQAQARTATVVHELAGPLSTDTPSPAQEPSSTPSSSIGPTKISEVDGMVQVYIPEGPFLMGSTEGDIDKVTADCANCERSWFEDELPQHMVFLDSYWIDRTEVTNAMYARCLAERRCSEPSSNASLERTYYFYNSVYANYPVVFVSWYDAQDYCEWVGGRLPTEAEWEKAARGTEGQMYPWGNDNPSCNLANDYGHCVGDTVMVGSYPGGASPYGVLDMTGNVWEWVSDWYDNSYYQNSPANNPRGPTRGFLRVMRGCSCSWFYDDVTVAFRNAASPGESGSDVGFRCVR
jgi:formylglycine-generating enzyme required for sulfatase activity/uncharacterized caspase-like protein